MLRSIGADVSGIRPRKHARISVFNQIHGISAFSIAGTSGVQNGASTACSQVAVDPVGVAGKGRFRYLGERGWQHASLARDA
jgi:hypothetical protein